jgi:WD40 repeat protein
MSNSFDVVCVPVGEYQRLPRLPADEVADQVTELLAVLGGRPVTWDLPPDAARTTPVVDERLRTWAMPVRSGRSSVLFWVGHGQSNYDGAWLATHDTPAAMNLGGVLPEKLAQFIIAEWRARAQHDGWAIVVIEACGGERFANLLQSLLLKDIQPPSRFAVIGVGAPDGPAALGEFRQVLADTLAAGSTAYTDCDDSIKLSDLVGQINERLKFGIVHDFKLHQVPPIPRIRRLPSAVTATMDVYSELQTFVAGLSADERMHFLPKAQGADHVEQGEPAWYFVGRDAERADIAAWLRTNKAGMLTVTGRAGSGKSALLGHLLVHSTPQLRDLLTQSGMLQPAPAGEFPAEVRFDAVVHLTGMTTADVVRRLASAAGLGAPPVDTTPGQDVDWLVEALVQRQQSFTVLIDALDEAQEPVTVASSILRRLATVDAVRIVAGTRASTKEGPDLPDTDDTDLLDALGEHDRVVVAKDADAIGRYVRLRLGAALPGDLAIDHAASLIQQRGQQFLYARLAVHEILADPDLVNDDNALDRLLSGDHRTLFAAAANRLAAQSPVTRPLLEALALARGRGLPRVDRVWLTVAGAVDPEVPATEVDIDQLLKAAAPYVMLDTEHGQSVYRLAHRTFVEHFRTSPTAADLHRTTTHDLAVATARALPALPNPYVVHHLAGHAAEALAWDVLAEFPAILDELDPAGVAAEVTRTAFGRVDLPPAIAAGLSANVRLAELPVRYRATVRALAMARLAERESHRRPRQGPGGTVTTVTQVGKHRTVRIVFAKHSMTAHIASLGIAGPPGVPWSVCATNNFRGGAVSWARLPSGPLHLVLFGHEGGAFAVAAVPMEDGRTLLASGGGEGTVRLWDPMTGLPLGPPLTGHVGAVNALAAVPLPDGRTLLASGGSDGTVRLWNPVTRLPFSPPFAAHEGGVFAVAAVPMEDGRTLLASGGKDKVVRLWDPVDGLVRYFEGHTDTILSLVTAPDESGRLLLVSGSNGMSVGQWDPEGGIVSPPEYSTFNATSLVVAVELTDGTARLVAVAKFLASGLIVMRPGVGEFAPRKDWLPHEIMEKVTALAAVPVDGGQPLVATAGAEGAIYLWQPFENGAESSDTSQVGDPLIGHDGTVYGIASVRVADRSLLASGGADGTVRLWNPQIRVPEAAADDEETAVPGDAVAVTDMALLPASDGDYAWLVTANRDETVRVWNTDTGLLEGARFPGQTGQATWLTESAAVGYTRPRDGRARVVIGSGRTVTVWYPYEGAETAQHWHTCWFPALPLKLMERVLPWMLMSRRVRKAGPIVALAALPMPDGRTLLAVAGGRQIQLWDLDTGRRIRCGWGHRLVLRRQAEVRSLAVVPQPSGGVLLATGDADGVVRLWDPVSRSDSADPLTGHEGSVNALAAVPVPDGSVLLASGGADGTVRLWDPESGSPVGEPLEGYAGNVTALAAVPLFSDAAILAIAGEGGLVRIQDVTGQGIYEVVPVDIPVNSLVYHDEKLFVGSHSGLVCIDINAALE